MWYEHRSGTNTGIFIDLDSIDKITLQITGKGKYQLQGEYGVHTSFSQHYCMGFFNGMEEARNFLIEIAGLKGKAGYCYKLENDNKLYINEVVQ